VNLPGAPVREIAGVRACDDAEASAGLMRLAAQWPGFETIVLYAGERSVAVLSNPSLGFAETPLEWRNEAA
jgi:hypothetical protein